MCPFARALSFLMKYYPFLVPFINFILFPQLHAFTYVYGMHYRLGLCKRVNPLSFLVGSPQLILNFQVHPFFANFVISFLFTTE